MKDEKFKKILESLRNCSNVKDVNPVEPSSFLPDGFAVTYILERKIGSVFFNYKTGRDVREIVTELEKSGATNIKCYRTMEVSWREEL